MAVIITLRFRKQTANRLNKRNAAKYYPRDIIKMRKQEYQEQERKRRYYFFDYLYWLGEMAQRHYKGEPRRPDGAAFLMFCFMAFIYVPVLSTAGHFLYSSSAFEWFTVAMIAVVAAIYSCIWRGWIYPFSRRKVVMQHYEGRKFSPARCYIILFSFGFLLIFEMVLIPTALKWITGTLK